LWPVRFAFSPLFQFSLEGLELFCTSTLGTFFEPPDLLGFPFVAAPGVGVINGNFSPFARWDLEFGSVGLPLLC